MADHTGTHFFSACKKSEPAALSAAWPTWPLHSPQMTFRAGEKVLSQEHGLRAFFSYRRRTPVAVPPKKVCETGISSKRKRGHKHSVQAVSAREFVQLDRVTLKLRRECDAVRTALQTLRPVGLLRERRRLKKPTCHHNVDTQRRA